MPERIYKLMALKAIIKDFATVQFMQNGITHEEGAFIMDGVNEYFQKSALEGVMLGMIQKPQESEVPNGNMDDNTES